MNAEGMTLTRFLGWDDPSMSPKIWSGLEGQKEQVLATVRVPWGPLRTKLIEKFAESMNMPLVDLCVAAWKKHEEIQQFADRTQYPAHETNHVNLLEHEISYDLKPTVDVSFGGVEFPPLKFVLKMSLKFEGCILTIKDGKIVAVLPGTGQGDVVLTWSDATVAKVETKKVDLGDEIHLTNSIAIAAA